MTSFRVVGMTNEHRAAEVRKALLARDPAARMEVFLARQILSVETRLAVEDVRKTVLEAGFIAVPQRRGSDRIDRTDVMRVAESSVIYAVGALYGGMALGVILAFLHVSVDQSCSSSADGCQLNIAMFAVGFALLMAFLVGGFAVVRGTRLTYRRVKAKRIGQVGGIAAMAAGEAGDRPVEDGTSGYVFVGRRPS